MRIALPEIPEGSFGPWKVERFKVSKHDAEREGVRALWSGSGRCVPEGEYIRLLRGGEVVMSDTPDELRDIYEPIYQARGRCLVNGLGLGVVVAGMLRKPEVEHVTVVEKSPEVIGLVGPHYTRAFGSRLEIVNADAFEYRPPNGSRFGAVWHDIWDNICGDNLPEMHRLHRKYGRMADWQGSWCRWRCERSRW